MLVYQRVKVASATQNLSLLKLNRMSKGAPTLLAHDLQELVRSAMLSKHYGDAVSGNVPVSWIEDFNGKIPFLLAAMGPALERFPSPKISPLAKFHI